MNQNFSERIEINFSYFYIAATFFVMFFITSKVIAVKFISLGGFIFNAGSLIFPLSYICSDILTEVYGYKRARQLIWTAIFCNILFLLTVQCLTYLPSIEPNDKNTAYKLVFYSQPRLVLASAISYIVGEFMNCFFLAKAKVRYHGSKIIVRFISSTCLGILMDVSLFTFISFIGSIPTEKIFKLILCEDILKVSYACIMSPISAKVCIFLKKIEKVDIFDTYTNFTPFSFDTSYQNRDNKFNIRKTGAGHDT